MIMHESSRWIAEKKEQAPKRIETDASECNLQEEEERKKRAAFRIDFRQIPGEELKQIDDEGILFGQTVEGDVINQDGKKETRLFMFKYQLITDENGRTRRQKLPRYEDLGLKPNMLNQESRQ